MASTIFVNGSLEEQREAGAADWAMHVFALPWKVTIGMMPPTSLAGGWACFFASLLGIAVLTTCISDLAELFGCVLGIPDIVTAVTFVALGTSMPDLFASLTAAKEDATADASIVNVTGSNSVNVFLGLGVPWTVAAVFWLVSGRTADWEAKYPSVASRITGSAFVVESADLGFGVGMFCYVSVLALAILQARRRWLECELGGPRVAKVLASSTLCLLWLAWVGIVSWRVLRPDGGAEEVAGVVGATLLATASATFATMVATKLAETGGGEEQEAQVVDCLETKVDESAAPFVADIKATGSVEAPGSANVGLSASGYAVGDGVNAPVEKVDRCALEEMFFAGDLGEEKPRDPMAVGVSGRPASFRACV